MRRRGSPAKPKINKHPASRRRECPACGKRFRSRPGFLRHLLEEARLEEEGADDA